MKSILFPTLVTLVLLVGPTQAETGVAKPLTTSQKTEAIEKAKDLLLRSVRYQKDGTAVSHYIRRGVSTRVEWRNLVFRQLILGSISPSDRERGINRRIYAQLGSEAYRLIDPSGTTPWRSGHCPGFPGYVLIEEIDGELVVKSPDLNDFDLQPQRNPTSPVRPLAGDERAVAKNL